MIKILIFIILCFIVSTEAVFAEIWDFGLGISHVSGRSDNYGTVPLQIEMGLSSVKGYGLSVSRQSTKSFSNLTKKEIIEDNTYSSEFGMRSDTLMIFYRFENYDQRWDLGLMNNRNIYIATIEKKGSSSEIGSSHINISYSGPYIQYSNTLKGYETDDWYYGLRIFSISTNNIDSSSYNIIVSDDNYLQDYNNDIKKFIYKNNPKNATGINITLGWRL